MIEWQKTFIAIGETINNYNITKNYLASLEQQKIDTLTKIVNIDNSLYNLSLKGTAVYIELIKKMYNAHDYSILPLVIEILQNILVINGTTSTIFNASELAQVFLDDNQSLKENGEFDTFFKNNLGVVLNSVSDGSETISDTLIP